jgi:hypothetical protein
MRRAAAWIVMALLCFGAVEIGAFLFNSIQAKRFGRIDLEQSPSLPSAYRTFQLNVTYGTGAPPDKERFYRTHNAQGFKYPHDTPKEKPANTLRIFALGGSQLYGWGSEGARYGNHMHLANDETVTFFLEQMIKRRLAERGISKDIEVINTGIPNYDSTHELIYYNETIYEYHPDMLILLDGNNELYGGKVYNPLLDNREGGRLIIDSFNERHALFTAYVVARYLAQYFKFANSLQYILLHKWQEREQPTVLVMHDLPATFDGFDANYDRRAHATFMRTYSQLRAATEYAHIPMIVFLQPEMLLEDMTVLSDTDRETHKKVEEDWMPSGAVPRDEFMRRVRAKMPGYMAEIGVEFHDVAAIASPATHDRALYIDYTHLTREGSEALAQRMFPFIFPKIDKIVLVGAGGSAERQ